MNKLLSAKEVSEILGTNERTVKYKLNLRYVKICGKRMYEVDDIENFIKRNKQCDYADNYKRKLYVV